MPDEPRRYLLAVGISEYDEWDRLDEVPNEVERIVNILTSQNFGMIRILHELSSRPISEELLTRIAEWAADRERRSTDQLVIYWSGHGFVDSQLYLILEKTKLRVRSPVFTVEQLVRPFFQSHPSIGPVLLILDVCFAGQGALDLARWLGDWTRNRPQTGEPQLAILCAAQSRKQSAQEALASAFEQALQTCAQQALEHEPYLFLDKILAETNRQLHGAQTAEIIGKYHELSFFANPRYVANPMERQGAGGRIKALIASRADYGDAIQRIPSFGNCRSTPCIPEEGCRPKMVEIPAGSFLMGCPDDEEGGDCDERPHHRVSIPYSFEVSSSVITFAEWETAVKAGGCNGYMPDDRGWGQADLPLISVSWYDAQTYVHWLRKITRKDYRLLSEAEWEYVARAGTRTTFWWGGA